MTRVEPEVDGEDAGQREFRGLHAFNNYPKKMDKIKILSFGEAGEQLALNQTITFNGQPVNHGAGYFCLWLELLSFESTIVVYPISTKRTASMAGFDQQFETIKRSTASTSTPHHNSQPTSTWSNHDR